jgi:acetyl/propionyl-CoA carboxylase alpha subunit/acetyl-CoA carboxylase carboxyltransferase component
MPLKKVLIANRGEIAIRIARAAAELDMEAVALFSEDDANSQHVRKADQAFALQGRGIAPYLDLDQVMRAAIETGCDSLHPGYGFLSENHLLATRCSEACIRFVGPDASGLRLFGDKSRACSLAAELGIPVVPGTRAATSLEEVKAFFRSPAGGGAVMIKAIAGGGGRGMRAVTKEADLVSAYEQCRAEAMSAFGAGDLYVERLMIHARHIEIQILGDGTGCCVHLGERECTLQRRNQKMIEIAPSPTLDPAMRARLTDAALRLASHTRYRSLGTFEFLVDASEAAIEPGFSFIEANPRIQVEHTITEMITGVDLVQAQLRIAGGETLSTLPLTQDRAKRTEGYAIQARINMERMDEDGAPRPAGGTLTAFEPPGGLGIRVDTYGYAGYTTSPHFDSLLAKLVVHVPTEDYPALLRKASRALSEFRIEGVPTNKQLLQGLLHDRRVIANQVDTRFLEEHLHALLEEGARLSRNLYVETQYELDRSAEKQGLTLQAGEVALIAPMQGQVASIDVQVNDRVQVGQQVAILEAMKMQHSVVALQSGILTKILARNGGIVVEGETLFVFEAVDESDDLILVEQSVDLDIERPSLAELLERRAAGSDDARADAVQRRHAKNKRTARENVADLMDAGSMVEYGGLAIASQRTRRSLDDLIRNTPADGIIIGVGSVNVSDFPGDPSRCMTLAYDFTVLAGTQGRVGHDKTERALHLARQWRLPIVLFAEGGGGRSGDVDTQTVAKLNMTTFAQFAGLSGLAPRVGIASGFCFAGNAGLLGCCDVIIATRDSSIGMAGPAMIEGGGLGIVEAENVGPIEVQSANGVVDVVVEDEAEAVRVAKKYLSYFQGTISEWEAPDRRLSRHAIPEDRRRAYDVRKVIESVVDVGSVLEMRRGFGIGIVTALVRVEGCPMGLIANNPAHLGGAIDRDAADKASRFMQLCDAFDVPILSLCDTPGFMVGPEAEKTGLVRHVCRMFVTEANLTVPFLAVITRKGYGLGAQAMCAGGFHQPVFTVAWPTGEVGAMGLEGFVRLGFKKDLEAIANPMEREARFDALLAKEYEKAKALHSASYAVLDDVIDPADTRRWIAAGLRAVPTSPARSGKKRPFVDTW